MTASDRCCARRSARQPPADVRFAVRRPVKGHVADNDVFFRRKGRTLRRVEDDLAAGEAFTNVVVGVAFQFEGHPARDKGAKTLAGRAMKVQMNRVFRQTLRSKTSGDLTAKNRANDPMGVADI